MGGLAKWQIVLGVIIFFAINFVLAFIVYPEIGEKILYGKHPPETKPNPLEYSEIILSGNYKCMESASIIADGDLPKFVKEFNICNS